jgi:hypothetical protein
MVTLSDIEYEKMKCDIQNLENDNAILKAQLSVLTERVKPLIVSFWEWFCSSTYVRDFSKHDEGLKYAEDFLNDMAYEATYGDSEFVSK